MLLVGKGEVCTLEKEEGKERGGVKEKHKGNFWLFSGVGGNE